MMKGLRRALAPLALLVCAVPASAYVPTAERIQTAMSETNVASGRGQAMRLEMAVQIGERAGVASAELISHPTGLARLELRGHKGLVERHLLQGNVLMVSRNGEMLDEHRYFLPPLFLLQADTSVTLRAALASLDVLVDVVGLAECGEADCFVIGDPARVVPRPERPPLPGLEVYEDGEDEDLEADAEKMGPEGAAGTELGGEGDDEGEAPRWSHVVVDTESFEIRGIETASGVSIELGPIAAFDKLRVPAWILVQEPGRAPVRFDVMRASQVNAPASAFTQGWLVSPIIADPAPTLSAPTPAEATRAP